jgi:hypothetical protein
MAPAERLNFWNRSYLSDLPRLALAGKRVELAGTHCGELVSKPISRRSTGCETTQFSCSLGTFGSTAIKGSSERLSGGGRLALAGCELAKHLAVLLGERPEQLAQRHRLLGRLDGFHSSHSLIAVGHALTALE